MTLFPPETSPGLHRSPTGGATGNSPEPHRAFRWLDTDLDTERGSRSENNECERSRSRYDS